MIAESSSDAFSQSFSPIFSEVYVTSDFQTRFYGVLCLIGNAEGEEGSK